MQSISFSTLPNSKDECFYISVDGEFYEYPDDGLCALWTNGEELLMKEGDCEVKISDLGPHYDVAPYISAFYAMLSEIR